VGLRGAWALRQAPRDLGPNVATACIGVLFATLVGLAGAWAYTDLLSDLVRQMTTPGRISQAMQAALAAALLAGALTGGLLAGTWHWPRPWPWRQTLRCLAGGALLGLGSLWVPGSNDGLLLLGLPLFWPHAWAALAVMMATIALLLQGQRRAAHRSSR
jgi:toxin CptA